VIDAGKTILDRYISLGDRLAEGAAELEELRSIFAADAAVQLNTKEGAAVGIDAILAYYRGRLQGRGGSKHFWNTHRIDDRTLEADWVAAGRGLDGSLRTASGFERALLNEQGLIRDLRNYPSRDAVTPREPA
jgi:hypothetical protein